jgi:phosphoserine phosphatase
MRFKIVCFDSGSIIEKHDIWLKTHELMETKEAASELIAKYHGKDERRFVQESVKMWRQHDAGAYQKLINKVEFSKGTKEIVTELHKRGYKVALIGEEPSQLGKRAKIEMGFDYEFTNEITIENNCFSGFYDWFVTPETKLTVLRDRLREGKLLLKDMIYVTGNPLDLKIIKQVGVAIAYCTDSVPLKEAANAIVKERNLLSIPAQIDKIEREGKVSDIFDK